MLEQRRQARANMARNKTNLDAKAAEMNERVASEVIHKPLFSDLPCKLHGCSETKKLSTKNVDNSQNPPENMDKSEPNRANCTVSNVQFARYPFINNNNENDLSIDRSTESAWDKLKNSSLKTVTPPDEQRTHEAYLAAIATGYTPVQIQTAYDRYVEAYQSTNDTPRYAKKLYDWLTQGGGLAYFAAEITKSSFETDRDKSKGKLEAADVTLNVDSLSLNQLRSYCYRDEAFSEAYGRWVLARSSGNSTAENLDEVLNNLANKCRAAAKRYLAQR